MNQKLRYLGKIPLVLFVTAVVMTPIVGSTIPTSSALMQGDFASQHDSHQTVLTGNTKVCGDHLCAPGEWEKLQAQIAQGQLGNHTGNVTQTAKMPSTAATTTATPANGGSSTICTVVKSALANANVGATVTQKVLSALGC